MNSENSLIERKVDHQIADTIGIGKGGINFDNAAQVMEYAKLMAASGSAVPKHLRGQPGACLGILDDAIRFRINPYPLARKSYFVNETLAYEAQVLMAIVNASPVLKTRPDIKWEGDGPERRCIVTGTFRDGEVRQYISPRFADIHPKNSPLWKSDPDQQHSYYSLRAFARRWCPEVILGVYDIDELRDAAMTDITPQATAAPAASAAPKSIMESLDTFAAGAVASPLTPDAADAGKPTPASTTAGASTPTLQSDAPAAVNRAEAIDKILALATDKDLDAQARLEELELRKANWMEQFVEQPKGPQFIAALFAVAAKVAKGEQKPAAARKYVEAMP
jgi:RecT family